MPGIVARVIAAIMTTGALASCGQASAPSGSPGSLSFSMHGRLESGVSVSPR